jgi:hypothetical protein
MNTITTISGLEHSVISAFLPCATRAGQKLAPAAPPPSRRKSAPWCARVASCLALCGTLIGWPATTRAVEPELKELTAAARAGSAADQFNLGRRHETGDGIAQDHRLAAKWYRAAANQGHATAQYRLGRLHLHGYGVPADAAQAARWYRRAAAQGLAGAQYALGRLYAAGNGVRRNHSEALLWYHRAAAQGHAAAQNMIGRMHEQGIGVPRDLAQAHRWFSLAARDSQSIFATANRARVESAVDPAALALGPLTTERPEVAVVFSEEPLRD